MEKIFLCGMNPEEILLRFGNTGLTLNHAFKITNGIYKKGLEDITALKSIPQKILKLIGSESSPGLFKPVFRNVSSDGTVKYLFSSPGGKKYETVFIPEGRRNTLCVSSQSGCRMGCSFCLTGKYGYHGNLSAAEIINQVISVPEAQKITHVVFMGMGEPMDNIDNVLKACIILTAHWGRSLSPRNITVSSVGITPGIRRFLSESACNLAVSLFSPFSEERQKLVPVEKRFPINEILEILKIYHPEKKRRFSLSYMMMKGVNDSDAHLQSLKENLRGSDIRVNLLPYHSAFDDEKVSSTAERMLLFKHELVTSGISSSIRKSRGEDISAACGLLASVQAGIMTTSRD